MAMRSQVYEWDAGRAAAGGVIMPVAANVANAISVFIGGLGNNITMPAQTTATQFIVIEDIGITPTYFTGVSAGGGYRGQLCAAASCIIGPKAFVNVRINTTDYFLDPDGVGNDGVPGTSAPYPRESWCLPGFNLYPDVYVLPGQVWDVRATYFNVGGFAGANAAIGELQAFCKYTLYDGPDALIANKLLEMGVSVNPGNVDWYKRTLISGSAAAAAATV